jgi:hypothetical protein
MKCIRITITVYIKKLKKKYFIYKIIWYKCWSFLPIVCTLIKFNAILLFNVSSKNTSNVSNIYCIFDVRTVSSDTKQIK